MRDNSGCAICRNCKFSGVFNTPPVFRRLKQNWNTENINIAQPTGIPDSRRAAAYACCSVLQCVAVCCSVLQCVAVCCSVLQCVVYMAAYVCVNFACTSSIILQTRNTADAHHLIRSSMRRVSTVLGAAWYTCLHGTAWSSWLLGDAWYGWLLYSVLRHVRDYSVLYDTRRYSVLNDNRDCSVLHTTRYYSVLHDTRDYSVLQYLICCPQVPALQSSRSFPSIAQLPRILL